MIKNPPAHTARRRCSTAGRPRWPGPPSCHWGLGEGQGGNAIVGDPRLQVWVRVEERLQAWERGWEAVLGEGWRAKPRPRSTTHGPRRRRARTRSRAPERAAVCVREQLSRDVGDGLVAISGLILLDEPAVLCEAGGKGEEARLKACPRAHRWFCWPGTTACNRHSPLPTVRSDTDADTRVPRGRPHPRSARRRRRRGCRGACRSR